MRVLQTFPPMRGAQTIVENKRATRVLLIPVSALMHVCEVWSPYLALFMVFLPSACPHGHGDV
jgi:hypothetical protein